MCTKVDSDNQAMIWEEPKTKRPRKKKQDVETSETTVDYLSTIPDESAFRKCSGAVPVNTMMTEPDNGKNESHFENNKIKHAKVQHDKYLFDIEDSPNIGHVIFKDVTNQPLAEIGMGFGSQVFNIVDGPGKLFLHCAQPVDKFLVT